MLVDLDDLGVSEGSLLLGNLGGSFAEVRKNCLAASHEAGSKRDTLALVLSLHSFQDPASGKLAWLASEEAGSEEFTDLASADSTVMSCGEVGVTGVVGESWTGGSSSLRAEPKP